MTGAPAVPAGARAVLATHNRGKLAELRRILTEAVPGFDPSTLVSAADIALPDVVEDGTSFAANALLKARAAALATGLIGIADDSGLAVDILGGSPGIFSARWSGRHGDDEANNALLLGQLGDIAEEHRGAEFVCAAAMAVPAPEASAAGASSSGASATDPGAAAASPSGGGASSDGSELGFVEVVEHGRMRGRLLTAPRGDGGFGYDPLFLPDDEDRTAAELSPQEKDAISHRGRAFRALAPAIIAAIGD